MTKTFTGWTAGAAVSALAFGAAFGSSAMAQNNQAYVDQVGGGNTADVTQSDGARFGTADDPALQAGDNNTITANQTRSEAGNGSRLSDDSIRGIDQLGDGNVLTINQDHKDNRLGVVQQSGGNTATINQNTGNNNYIAEVNQFNTGGTANVATLEQSGERNKIGQVRDTRKVIGGVFQTGTGNEVTLTQSGDWNAMHEVRQSGDSNTVSASFTGDRNGTNPDNANFSGYNNMDDGTFTPGTNAADVAGGLTPGTITQDGSFHNVDFEVTSGDYNTLAFSQTGGTDNGIGDSGVFAVSGSDNLMAFSQVGSFNDIDGTISGDDNDLGLEQNGDSNTIFGTIVGSTNEVAVAQTSSNNIFDFSQSGDGNVVNALQN